VLGNRPAWFGPGAGEKGSAAMAGTSSPAYRCDAGPAPHVEVTTMAKSVSERRPRHDGRRACPWAGVEESRVAGWSHGSRCAAAGCQRSSLGVVVVILPACVRASGASRAPVRRDAVSCAGAGEVPAWCWCSGRPFRGAGAGRGSPNRPVAMSIAASRVSRPGRAVVRVPLIVGRGSPVRRAVMTRSDQAAYTIFYW
jgi:hypothetical protein